MPSFSLQVKNELARITAANSCCQRAELAALIQMGLSIRPQNEPAKLVLQTENAAVARKIYKLIKDLFQCKAVLSVKKKQRLRKNNIYILKTTPLINLEKFLGKITGPAKYSYTGEILFSGCCQRAYLRGVFLAGGSLNNPEKNYHLEISAKEKEMLDFVCGIMRQFEIEPHTGARKGLPLIYFKESEQIAALLNVTGAHQALLKLENIRIFKEVRNNVNRQVNCETANLNKTVEASIRQIENIKFIQRTLGLAKLPPALRQVAELRLEFPDSNLRELGQMLDPPLGKSGINHRLRRLEEIINKLREGKN